MIPFIIAAIIGLLILTVLVLGAFAAITFLSALGDYDHGDPNEIHFASHPNQKDTK
jgi:hypothetical protein